MAGQFDSFTFTSLYHSYLVSCLCSHSFLSARVLWPSFQAWYSSDWHHQLQSLCLFLFFTESLSTALSVSLLQWSCFWKCHLAKFWKLIPLAGMTDQTTHSLLMLFFFSHFVSRFCSHSSWVLFLGKFLDYSDWHDRLPHLCQLLFLSFLLISFFLIICASSCSCLFL